MRVRHTVTAVVVCLLIAGGSLIYRAGHADAVNVDGELHLSSKHLSFRRLTPPNGGRDGHTLRLTYQLTDNPHHVLWFDIVLPGVPPAGANAVKPTELWLTVHIPGSTFDAGRRLKYRGVDGELILRRENGRVSGRLDFALRTVDEDRRSVSARAVFHNVWVSDV